MIHAKPILMCEGCRKELSPESREVAAVYTIGQCEPEGYQRAAPCEECQPTEEVSGVLQTLRLVVDK